MKKILFTLFLTFALSLSVNAATWNAADRVPVVGKQILSKNNLPADTVFKVSESAQNSEFIDDNLVIYVPETDLETAGNDNEVAAIVSHEIGLIINASASKKEVLGTLASALTGASNSDTGLWLQEFSMNKLSEKEEMTADITGVDLMIAAGYNPLARIVTLTKEQATTMELLTGKIPNAKRAMYVYDYLVYNYPSKVKAGYNCQEYRNFLAYAQPTIDERNSNKKKLEKFQKEQAKLKQERAKQIATFKATGGLTGWDASYTILKNLYESSETK